MTLEQARNRALRDYAGNGIRYYIVLGYGLHTQDGYFGNITLDAPYDLVSESDYRIAYCPGSYSRLLSHTEGISRIIEKG